jgi:hypothetical protein
MAVYPIEELHLLPRAVMPFGPSVSKPPSHLFFSGVPEGPRWECQLMFPARPVGHTAKKENHQHYFCNGTLSVASI